MTHAYETSPINSRRTKRDIETLRAWLYWLLYERNPMTVRQVFYQAVSAGVIAKTEQEYKGTICRLLTRMRKDDELPYSWIADNTRWMRKPKTHSSLQAMLEETAKFYRRALWQEQKAYVEIWLEKDALSGVLWEVTSRYDVPLMVTRGYPSFSFLAGAAEAIEAQEKPVYLYYFGDQDPSGVDISRNVEEQLGELAPCAEIHFERVAVNPWQIGAWNLPTRPTKQSDTRARNFKGDSVEVDAIEPGMLLKLVEDCITQHIDTEVYRRTLLIEERERETLKALCGHA
jgi:hypothetical protein